MLTVNVQDFEDDVILQCSGRILRGEETGILCAALAYSGRNVILDLAEVDAIDESGIGMLISLQAAGIYLKLVNPNDRVLEMLKVKQADSIFEIYRPRALESPSKQVSTNDLMKFAGILRVAALQAT
jgi:anti-anti-sigma regulatory factor